jgi:hypothetical protein
MAERTTAEEHGDVEMQEGSMYGEEVVNPIGGKTEDQIRESTIDVHHVIRSYSTNSAASSVITASVTDVLSNGNVSYDRFVKLSNRIKSKIDEACRDWDDNDDDKTFLKSSHMVLYKWHDYMSFPTYHPFANRIWGSRQKDQEGRFLPEDNHCRFLFVFHDFSSFYIVGLSYIVIFGEISMLIAIVSQLIEQNCNHALPKGTVTMVPLILCTLYASSVAAESFFHFTPFELTGQTKESYCAIADILVALGQKSIPRYINFNKMFSEDLKRIAEEDPSRKDAVNKILLQAALRDSSTFILTIALQAANILLLTTVAIVMGTSHSVLLLVQNFVSVEIIVHIHEFVPKALRLRDLSPHAFNSSFTAVRLCMSLRPLCGVCTKRT